MTAEGRAFLPNKVGERNRNVGINESIRELIGHCRLATPVVTIRTYSSPKSVEYLGRIPRAAAVNHAGRGGHEVRHVPRIRLYDAELIYQIRRAKICPNGWIFHSPEGILHDARNAVTIISLRIQFDCTRKFRLRPLPA